MAFLLALLTFLLVGVVAIALVAVTGVDLRPDVMKRLHAISNAERRGQGTMELKLLRDELLSDVPLLNRMLLRWSWPEKLRRFVGQAGWSIKPAKLVLIGAVMALAAFVIVMQLRPSIVLEIAAAAIAGFAPFGVLLFVRSKRLHAFEKIFPEAIDLLGRSVRAGHAFTTGLEMIAQEMPEPVAGEFRITYEEQNFGLPLKEALLNLSDRMPLVDVRFFVTALLIQKESGGNLAEILDKLAYVVRDRFRILGDVKTKTAQGRLTAAILIILPPAMLMLMRVMNPEYIRPLFEDPWGPYMLGAAVILQLLGTVVLWKIVQIEV
jgi:tight adherence protein B